ncbi:MAG TPA: trigger factor [Paracoccaceae bacterium]|nr:trigger factor [Paracoccaceae bacterium]
MQVTETLNEGLKRGYSLVLTAAALEAKVNSKLEAARADFHMKGFRKGRAPVALLKKMFGKSVLGEAMQEAVDDALKTHFEQSGDRPARQPEVKIGSEEWKEGEDLTVEMSYEKLPEVPEVDFSAVSLERLETEVDETAIGEALDNLARSASGFEPKEGDAAEGDQVLIDFVGRMGGEVFEGGSGEDYPLVLGGGAFIPGLEDQLVGAQAGETREVAVVFPDSYGAKNLAGNEAVFSVTVKEVRRSVPAPIDDELAKKFGSETLEDLKGQIRERLAAEYRDASRAVLKRKLMDALDGLVQFELPTVLVEQEAKQVAHQLWHEEHPDHHGHDHEEIEPTPEHRRLAERRVRLGLLLADVGAKAKIAVSENELNQAVMRQALQYRGHEKRFFEIVKSNPQMLQTIQAPIYEDKVVDHLLGLVQVTERTVTKDELQEAIEALDQE